MLEINCDIGTDGWSRLGCFFENNRNLSTLTSKDYEIGQGALNLANTLCQVKHSSLKDLNIMGADMNDEQLAVITEALRFLPELDYLNLESNNIGRSGCVALGNALGRLPALNRIEILHLNGNALDDEAVQALAAGVVNCSNLTTLSLEHNHLITAAGLRSLSPLFQSCCLSYLFLDGINFGDEGMIALAEGLVGNETFKELTFDIDAASITSVGWSAFSKLLCDTSTINNTYLSNHTLKFIDGGAEVDSKIPQDVERYLSWNRYPADFNIHIARCKILYSHPDLDLEPLLKWKSKFIPIVDGWYQSIIDFLNIATYRSSIGKLYIEAIFRSEHSDSDIDYHLLMKARKSLRSRKLSAMYKFIRDMPDLAVTGYWLRQVNYVIQTKKRKLDDAQRKLDERVRVEQRRLDEEKQRLKDEEDAAWERLGGGALPANKSNSRNKRVRHE